MLDQTLTDEQAKDIINDAALSMEEHGWVPYYRHDSDGRVCVLGALENAMKIYPDTLGEDHPIIGWLLQRLIDNGVIPRKALRRYKSVTKARVLADWSNESNGADVVAALRKVAE